MRRLMIDTILATDMGLHFKYMADLSGFEGAGWRGGEAYQRLFYERDYSKCG